MPISPVYVLITPARNEAQFIELTIQSVASQAVLPMKWVIVSDGSTDGTDDIVRKYVIEYSWIELVRMPERQERHFAGKVRAFNAGYAKVKHLQYQIIGNLDADVSFDDKDYFDFLLNKFAEDPQLGVAGTPFTLGKSMTDCRFANLEDVAGACQLFRRECFEEIGGYSPLKHGGVDDVAFLTARMKGWKTRTFTEKLYLHHRESGTADRGVLMARFTAGGLTYALGSHPAWEVFRTFYQMSQRPFVVGGLLLLAGYLWAMARGVERIPHELVAFRRCEQMRRLWKLFETTRPRFSTNLDLMKWPASPPESDRAGGL